MRTSVILLSSFVLAACSISTTPNSITFKPQKKFEGQPVTKTAAADWANQPITIDNANGDVTVIGDATITKVTVTATPVSWADDSSKEADAMGTISQVAASIVITESGNSISVKCSQASSSVGTSGTSTTGCDGFTVKVPAGSAATAANVTAKAENGTISATGITGSADITGNDPTVSVTPTKGSTLAVLASLGDINLSLPADFAADSLSLTGSPVTITGFSDVTATSKSRNGSSASSAASIKAESSFGLNLKSQ